MSLVPISICIIVHKLNIINQHNPSTMPCQQTQASQKQYSSLTDRQQCHTDALAMLAKEKKVQDKRSKERRTAIQFKVAASKQIAKMAAQEAAEA
jgi:hypothetical protein